jgi:hypothetical protein
MKLNEEKIKPIDSGHPSNHTVHQAVAEIAASLDLEELSFKKVQRLVRQKIYII